MGSATLRIAVTADLHYGIRHAGGNAATRRLAERLRQDPPDVLLLAGDLGAGDDFARCLDLFEQLPCIRAAVPGNHDIWVRSGDPRGDSLDVYDRHLPQICRDHGVVYLDHQPWAEPRAGLAIVGSMNWYDYSWDLELLQAAAPDWQERLASKRFTRGQHNDANFVRWGTTDAAFTERVVTRLLQDLDAARQAGRRVIVVTHHPPVRGLLYPAQEPLSVDALLWRAFSGNARLERELTARADAVPFVLCGHTHAARMCAIGPMHGINIGGDYHFKRLVWIDWPAGSVRAEEFHADH